MTIIQGLIFGIVQGLAEMLPISSSAHLVLLPWFFNFSDPGLAFDVALHIGTLFALIIYFWKDWLKLAKDFLKILKTRKIETFEQKLAGFLVVASIPGAFFGYLLDEQAETIFRSPLLVSLTLTILGLLLIYADNKAKETRKLEEMKVGDSMKIGLSQALAIIPGVSRSGITITAGLLSHFRREDAARFSFLMSAPIIAGAGIIKLKDLTSADITSLPFIVAFLAAVASSLLAIKFLLTFVKKHSFRIFAYYRFFLAFLILIFFFTRS